MADSAVQTPHLTPQLCFNERALRDFLRLSRSTLDDPIHTQLNSLSTPSTTRPFSPLMISPRRPTLPSSKSTSNTLPPSTCRAFLTTALFPHWSARDSILTYCSLIATSPDPDDPDLPSRNLEAEKQSLRRVDERLDPYSGRWEPKEARTERLADVLRLEGGVERIVRERVWDAIEGRCGDMVSGAAAGSGIRGWEEAYEKWKRERPGDGVEM